MRVAAVGDIMLGDSSHFLGRGVGTLLRRSPAIDLLRGVRSRLATADLFLGNLESPLAEAGATSSWGRVYRGEAASAPRLSHGRCTVMNLANNHMFEHGRTVAAGTGAALDRASIRHVGGRGGVSTSVDEVLVDIAGQTVQVVATSVIRDRLSPAVDVLARAHEMAGAMRAGGADVRIATIHWGDEYVTVPSPRQVEAARVLVAGGAQLVLGHHPHVLQPIERVGPALVAYSLGNFLFDHNWTRETRIGGILHVDLGADGVRSWEFQPTVRGGDGAICDAGDRDSAWAQGVVQGAAAFSDDVYRSLLARASRRHRLAMKLELLRNATSISRDTWHFLLTKRRRPALDESGDAGGGTDG